MKKKIIKTNNTQVIRKPKIGLIIFTTILVFIALSLITSSITNAVTDKLFVIPIQGTITNSDQSFLLFEESGNVPFILSCLEKAKNDNTIKSVILDINSPGGTVIGSSNIADKVIEVKNEKPVVSFINEVGASGAYWIATTTDIIIAEPFSITGSIGVTSSYLQYSGLLQNYNVTYQRLVTGEFKDLGTPYKDLTDKERNVLMSKLNIIHEEFSNIVAENRGLTKEEVNKVNNGLFFLGKEALELKLVDELGNMNHAESVGKELAENQDLKTVRCSQSNKAFPFLKASTNFAYYLGKGIGDELVSSSASDSVPLIR